MLHHSNEPLLPSDGGHSGQCLTYDKQNGEFGWEITLREKPHAITVVGFHPRI